MVRGRLVGIRPTWALFWTSNRKLRPGTLAALRDFLRCLHGSVVSRVPNPMRLEAISLWTGPGALKIRPFCSWVIVRYVRFWAALPPLRIRAVSRKVFPARADDRARSGVLRGPCHRRLRIPLIRRSPHPRSPLPPGVWVRSYWLILLPRNAPAPIPRKPKMRMSLIKNTANAPGGLCTDFEAVLIRRPLPTLDGVFQIPLKGGPMYAIMFPVNPRYSVPHRQMPS